MSDGEYKTGSGGQETPKRQREPFPQFTYKLHADKGRGNADEAGHCVCREQAPGRNPCFRGVVIDHCGEASGDQRSVHQPTDPGFKNIGVTQGKALFLHNNPPKF